MSDEQTMPPSAGFGTVTKDVALDPALSMTAKATYLVLAVHRDSGTSSAFPSMRAIAAALGCSRSTVKRALAELEQAQVVTRRARFRDGRQTSNVYVLWDAVARRGRT